MDISISTPALIFPAITVLILAYTNRFIAISARIRVLHDEYRNTENKNLIVQINSLHKRILIIRNMQIFGAISFIMCIVCMFLIFLNVPEIYYNVVFLLSLVLIFISLLFSIKEILLSTKALTYSIEDNIIKEKGN